MTINQDIRVGWSWADIRPYRILYLDLVKGIDITTVCIQQNDTTGLCDDTVILVNTRTSSLKMTKEEKLYVDGKIDEVLGPWCFPASKVDLTVWSADLPACGGTPQPEDFVTLVNSLRDTLPKHDAQFKFHRFGMSPF